MPYYEASSLGRVRRVLAGRKPGKPTLGYRKTYPGRRLTVNGPDRRKTHPVHLLVCAAFYGPKPEGLVCLHLNENSLDNRAGNLGWGTQKHNLNAPGFLRTASRLGYRKRLTPADYHQMAAWLREGVAQIEVGRRIGVTASYVNNLCHGRARIAPQYRQLFLAPALAVGE